MKDQTDVQHATVNASSSSKLLAAGAIAIAVLGFIGLMAWGLLNKAAPTGQSGVTRVRQPAPEFTLALFDGGQLTLSELRGRPVVINFWASWCIPCREEAPVLERTWRAYKDTGVKFVGVDIQDTEEDARDYLRAFDITYPNGPDPQGRISIDYGVVGIPVTFFVNREGTVARRFVGAINDRQLTAWIDELVAGAAPSGDVEEGNPESYFELDARGGRP